MRFFLLLLSLLVVHNVYPQCANTFRYTLQGSGTDAAYDIQELSGGDLVIGGQTNSFGAGGYDFFLIRITKTGNIVWSKTFGGPADETIRKMRLARDGNILITGQTRSFGHFPGHALAMKVDVNGNVIWSVAVAEGNETTLGVDIYSAADNSVILSGSSYQSSSTSDWLVAKIDGNGNLAWFKRLDGSFTEDVFSVIQKGDTLIVNGDSSPLAEYSLVMAKLSFADGTLYETRAFQMGNKGAFSSNLQYSSGQYRINSHLINASSYAQKEDAFIILDTASLTPLNSFKIHTSPNYNNYYFTGFYQTADGGFIAATSPSASNEGYLYRFNQQSNLVSTHRYTSSQNLILSGAVEDSDGAIWLVGTEGNDAVVMRLTANGEFEYCTNEPVQGVTTPISISDHTFSWISQSLYNAQMTTHTPVVTDFTFQIDQLCNIPVCGNVQITGPATSCSLTDSLTYFASTGAVCATNWRWILPAGISSRMENDSMIRLLPSGAGTYEIIVENLAGCSIQRDTLTLTVTVSSAPRSIHLGSDTTLCTAATLLLDAGAGFDRYLWQNNSTGRTLVASAAGTYFVRAWNSCNEEFSDTIQVRYRQPSDFIATPQDTTYCNPLSPVQLSATGGQVYQWSPATYLDNAQIANPVARPAATITYTVTITDTVCNVSQTRDVNIRITPSPRSINLGNDTSLCNATILLLDAGAGFARYQWQNNSTAQTLTVSSPGTYFVRAWNDCNEVFTDTVQVRYRSLSDFTATPQDTAYCIPSAAIQLSATGGQVYQWSPASFLDNAQIANPVARPDASITYTVTITDNVCNVTQTRDVEINITPSPRSISLGNDTVLCRAATLALDAGVGFARYQWQDNSTGQRFTVSGPGTYFVTAWNSCNEAFTDTIRVRSQAENFVVTPQDTMVCTSFAPVQLAASGGHLYQWSPVEFLDDPQVSNPVSRPGAAITYSVTITDTVCNVSRTLDVHVNVVVSPRSINLGNDTTLCNAATITLDAGAGFARYQWQDNSTNQTYNTGRAGIYTVRAWNSCNEMFTDNIRISQRSADNISVTPGDTAFCTATSPIQFNASGGDLYQWMPATYLDDPLISNPTGRPDASITYTVTISDTVCNYSRDLQVNVTVNASPDIQLSKTNDVNCAVGAAQLSVTGADRYEWMPDASLSAVDIANPVVRPRQTTTYRVKAYSTGGCMTEDSITVNFENTGVANIYLPTAFTPNGDGRNDIFRVVTTGAVEMKELSVFNRWGELVFSSNNISRGWDGTCKGVISEPGAYYWFVKATTPCAGEIFKRGHVILIK
ncbi:gliding motility-associated C-terminal domain-containing protein [Chitinophaga rhizophila]|uniref:Gliding motility-associated C-terminal domain-containing protein n=1 Tax=Chitinophaga rhizophila TaxID=2866212 RepID=A0ABS7GEA3_9BACT|nr:gliding motility-associated C-terminal domain-containing protein [Chitinophaga rhizophila]MBW8685987.1 gliding motility-associated C-terminal domain-containing protein [Chitinophaga rhizophila]